VQFYLNIIGKLSADHVIRVPRVLLEEGMLSHLVITKRTNLRMDKIVFRSVQLGLISVGQSKVGQDQAR
jgi:hypothetical protein